MPINPELLDELLKEYKSPDDMFGSDGLLQQLTKALAERAMQAELTHHLGYEKNSKEGQNTGNSRNGSFPKTVKGKRGQVQIDVPRDRAGQYQPQIIKKGQTRFDGFDDKIISMYSRGMTVRDIQAHLKEIYGVDVSPDLISSVTDAVIDEVRAWQTRPLDQLYPILYLDALVVKVKDQGRVSNKAIYLAIGVNCSGLKEVLGMWASETEGAKFWLSIITELRNRGVKDIFIACVDGLKGFPEAIESVYPRTQVQLCLVHQVRNSLKYVSWKWRKEVTEDLKLIYTAATVGETEMQLEAFARKWDEQLPTIGKSWWQNWERLIPFLSYPAEIRRVIYTKNVIESVNSSLRKVMKNHASFPTEGAVIKLMYLTLRNISGKWNMPVRDWASAMNRFAIMFEGRMPVD
jgi:putative transposase